MSDRKRLATVRKLVTMARFDLWRMLRDRQGAFFVLIFPMLLVLVLGAVFGGATQATLGVSAPAGDPLADEVVAAIEEHDEVEVRRYDDADSLRDAVEHARVEAGAVIPGGYSDRLQAGDDVVVGFLAGPSGVGRQLQPVIGAAVDEQAVRLQAARFAAEQGGVGFETALDRATEQQARLPEVTVRTTAVGESIFDEDDFGTFDVSASSQILLFMFVIGLAGSAGLIQTRQLGVSRRMLSTPTSAGTILLGAALGRFVQVMFEGLYIMVGTWLVFGVNWGTPLAAMVLLTAFGLVATGAAMLAGAVFRNEQQASSVGVFVGLGLAALGGSMAPLAVFPDTMRQIAHVTPHAWANEAFYELIGDDAGLVDILPEVAALLAMAAVILTLAAWRLRRALTIGPA
jgi:linearmycin/streptolysin S transport system permease protein